MFQVVVEVAVAVGVVAEAFMGSPFPLLRCVYTIIVATNIYPGKISLPRYG
jgi:hypothetical protein